MSETLPTYQWSYPGLVSDMSRSRRHVTPVSRHVTFVSHKRYFYCNVHLRLEDFPKNDLKVVVLFWMYRNDARKSIKTARKSLKEARINSNSHAESKNFLGTLCLWIDVLRVLLMTIIINLCLAKTFFVRY